MNYYLSSSDHVTGPYEKEELIDSYKYGMVSPDSTICADGSDQWLPISVLTEKKATTEIVTSPQTPFTELQETAAQPISVQQNYYQTKSPGIAILLEILPGIFLQTFGIGTIYAGNLTKGLILMLTYWAMAVVNFFLLFIIVGFVTWPVTFIIYFVVAIITSQKAVERTNWTIIMEGKRKV